MQAKTDVFYLRWTYVVSSNMPYVLVIPLEFGNFHKILSAIIVSRCDTHFKGLNPFPLFMIDVPYYLAPQIPRPPARASLSSASRQLWYLISGG